MAEPSRPGPAIPDPVRDVLLRMAREAVETWVRETRRIAAPAGPALPPPLGEPRGVFVTLETRDGRLRGCIGHPFPVMALGAAVVACAVSAASEDPRFEPVRAGELPGLRIELSVLTVPQAGRPEQVEVGR